MSKPVTQRFIEKAIQGEYPNLHFLDTATEGAGQYRILLDPLAWQAVGRVDGWDERMHKKGGSPHREEECWCQDYSWRKAMHRMIDALAEGKTVEQYLATILNQKETP